jgi:pyruvate formate lyase activating enzyme
MEISNVLKQTLIDFPGKLACEVFTKGCNYHCPTCHSKHLLNLDYQEDIFSYLQDSYVRKFIEGVVLCGGEPTIQKELPEFLKKIKDLNLGVKLDTNGSNPEVLEELIKNKLVDYIAMDVKAPKALYPLLTGFKDVNKIEESMKIISNSLLNYEFRTTIVPFYDHDYDHELRFMNKKEIINVSKWIAENASRYSIYYLQPFVSRGKDEILEERFSKERLGKEFWQTPMELLDELRREIVPYLPNCEVRR